MRTGFLVLFLVFAGGLSSACADVATSTSAVVNLPGFAPCSLTGPTTSSCFISSGNGDIHAESSASAGANQFSGGVKAEADGFDADVVGPVNAEGRAQVQIEGEYVLSGGTGTGSFDLNYDPFTIQAASVSCSVTVHGGNAQSCKDPVIVEYGVPFLMDVELSVLAHAGGEGEGLLGQATVDFSQQGLGVTPEPSSILLLMPGLAGVFGMRMRRRDQ